MGFFDYLKRAEERAAELKRLGITDYQDIRRHYERKAMLGADYRERESGSWKQTEAFLKAHPEHDVRKPRPQ